LQAQTYRGFERVDDINQATGEFVCVLQSGYVLDPTYFEKCIFLLEAYGLEYVQATALGTHAAPVVKRSLRNRRAMSPPEPMATPFPNSWYGPHRSCRPSPLKSRTHRTQRANRTCPLRGLLILVARLTAREHARIFRLCHYFAISKWLWENESCYLGQNEMAGLKGKSGPPGNMNAFKHGLVALQKRREESIPTEHEENVRQQILDGLIADKGGDEQISFYRRGGIRVTP
jgi:hypothetical protein